MKKLRPPVCPGRFPTDISRVPALCLDAFIPQQSLLLAVNTVVGDHIGAVATLVLLLLQLLLIYWQH